MIHIDGTMGEGGGQVLRTALSLSAITGTPFGIERIRGGRRRPGLRRQHLAAVQAAARITGARCVGDEMSSASLSFVPGAPRPGSYHFDIGSAGSATLVLQTVLPVLFFANAPSELTVAGGTHNPMAPPFDFLASSFAPLIAEIGFPLEATLLRHGFFPAGGGELIARTRPAPGEAPPVLDLVDRGRLVRTSATILLANLPDHIAERERNELVASGLIKKGEVKIRTIAGSDGPGNALWIERSHENAVNLFAAFGQKGKRAEQVAREAVRAARSYEKSGRAALEPHLADQVLLYMALRRTGRFTTNAVTAHLETNMAVIERFLPVRFSLEKVPGAWEVSCLS